ncbi:arginine beta-hydroxylase, Fe(II)/alpha-ketoglutarate-dependent [Brasilonema octagenarum UFV-E1]|uniref:Arginine beta-hydroxylase, Fe(II)/alpha-ketoglutarate-dependent n=2 Tax=Brasilonema TaxID=383614 RepID=A0A856MCN9_9CYAN|nr:MULTISPECIES: guanitoxin biosynthesis L-enduracididine beta-hydroxylase GntD [Brasilonema]NMF63626.1 arginine beta-hydroxylase, Fe(II)/alpha-ketoglutarate-dependent [Brasilonema octagenarum UFV-OR1]QDL08090.1 arginine beta-hydroxylase, Fe(II)/alpha-ketoglutarate-dependent [Brasilonema sennae CENA114]QDL14449.1 arginine beta-hydroxylase, Fe(II)/alpha-ketoglutarate-dependent [Brasilonema octagenarum UFV-E1]
MILTPQKSLNSSVSQIHLTKQEIDSIQHLVKEITSKYSSVEDENFLINARVFAHDLPKRLCYFINEFRLKEVNAVCLISGNCINEKRICKTPIHWKTSENNSTLLEEVLFILYGSLLGEVFTWGTHLEERQIIHNILPVEGYENEQLSCSSETDLLWHTEDAFHPHRADYLGLMCLRNPDKVETTFASIDMVNLASEHIKVLFEPRFCIRPDKSHTKPQTFSAISGSVVSWFEDIQNNQKKVPVLFGDPKSPYMCLDPLFMHPLKDDEEAIIAFNELIKAIDYNLKSIVLQPGDICLIDNYRSVHGRKAFYARNDGNDRWLKRIFLTSSLRKSRQFRASASSRILF